MAKVTIPVGKTRTDAKDHGKIAPLYKPAASPGPAKAYLKPPTVAQDKAYNSKQM
jgi:hypothetical protein